MIRKIKISQIPTIAESLDGLITYGVTPTNEPVQIPLSLVESIITESLSGKADLVNGKIPALQLPEGQGVADGTIIPGKIGSREETQGQTWNILFTLEGHWTFIDDTQSVDRPDGLPVPAYETLIPYKIITLGISAYSRPACLAITDDLKFYYLVQGADLIIRVTEVASLPTVTNLIGDINTIMDFINGEVI